MSQACGVRATRAHAALPIGVWMFRSLTTSLAAALSLVLTVPTATSARPDLAGPLAWKESYPIGLRSWQTFATNPANGHVIMFGGLLGYASGVSGSDTTRLGDTWEWDGTRWHAFDAAGPRAREGASAAFNPITGRMMLFGGRGCTPGPNLIFATAHTDTWEWDGARWTQLDAVGPMTESNRSFMAFDPVRSVMTLAIGSSNSQTPCSTWEWSGSTWVLRNTGAVGVVYSSLAYDAGVGRLVALQTEIVTNAMKTVEWSGTEWLDAQNTAVPWTSFYSVLGDVATGRVYVVSRTTDSISSLWLRESGLWVHQRDIARPPFSDVGVISLAWDGSNATHMSMGAITAQTQGTHNTFILDGSEWIPKAPIGPGARLTPVVVQDTDRNVTFMFGTGIGGNINSIPNAARSETWEFDGTTWLRKGTAAEPNPTTSLGAMYHDPQSHLITAPRLTTSGIPVWKWDGTTWTQHASINPPQRRIGSSGVYHAGIGRFVVIGGHSFTGEPALANSTWLFDGSAWTEMQIPAPPPRDGPKLCYDSARQRIVFFGGILQNPYRELTDVWEFDGTAWTQVPSGPPDTVSPAGYPALYDSMAYDAARGRTVLIQSLIGPGSFVAPTPYPLTAPTKLWEWDGESWTSRRPTQPVRPYASTRAPVHFWYTASTSPNFYLRRLAVTPGFNARETLAFDPFTQTCLAWGGANAATDDGSGGPYAVAPASLVQLPASTIIAHPAAVTMALAGKTVSLEARIAMDDATYQWTRNNVPLVESARVVGTNTEALTIYNTTTQDDGEYLLIATSPSRESLETQHGTVRIRPLGDFNADFRVDTKDLVRFLSVFGSANRDCILSSIHDPILGCLEDLNADGTINTKDLTRFLGEMARWNTLAPQD